MMVKPLDGAFPQNYEGEDTNVLCVKTICQQLVRLCYSENDLYFFFF